MLRNYLVSLRCKFRRVSDCLRELPRFLRYTAICSVRTGKHSAKGQYFLRFRLFLARTIGCATTGQGLVLRLVPLHFRNFINGSICSDQPRHDYRHAERR